MPDENEKSGPSAGSGPCAPVAWVARGKGADLGAGRGAGEGNLYVLAADGESSAGVESIAYSLRRTRRTPVDV